MQQTMSRGTTGGPEPSVGANFLVLLLLVSSLGFGLGAGFVAGSGAAFAFVMAGWVLGLCLHEFGHAFVARRAGGEASGALSLDPLRFAHPVVTVVLPLLFTVLGGIGFPGGAMPLESEGLRDRAGALAVALGGPAMTLLCLVVLTLLYHLANVDSGPLRAVLAVSVLFQGMALVLSLVPVPGLDGYRAVRPWLPPSWRAVGDVGAQQAGFVLLVLFLVSGAFSRVLFRASLGITAAAGIDPGDVVAGYRLIRLW
ncbi:site-2 protease family protein [Methylobacterium gossipiicola]|nr:site-2 protease family protein [Methylobacterium gossipiicola]